MTHGLDDDDEFEAFFAEYADKNRGAPRAPIIPFVHEENSKGSALDPGSFTCTICGLLKRERVSSSSKYCRQCHNGYYSYRSKTLRAEKVKRTISMDEYRAYREREGLPVTSGREVQRGRPVAADPNDIRTMGYVEFWKYVALAYKGIMPEHRIAVRIDEDMYLEATPNGLYPVHGKIGEFEED